MNIILITGGVALWFVIWGTLMSMAISYSFRDENLKAILCAFTFFFILCLPLVYFTQGVSQ